MARNAMAAAVAPLRSWHIATPTAAVCGRAPARAHAGGHSPSASLSLPDHKTMGASMSSSLRKRRTAPRRQCQRKSSTTVGAAILPAVAAVAEVAELFDNPLTKAFDSDGTLPTWFPIVSFVAYLWVTNEVRKFRQEQERKVIAKAAQAASQAAQRKVESIPPNAWAKLAVCVLIDALGDSSFLIPGLGELSDGLYAPLEAFLLGQLFQSNAVSGIGFVEEALPFTDVLPTATLAWVVENFFSETGVAKVLGLAQKDTTKGSSESPDK